MRSYRCDVLGRSVSRLADRFNFTELADLLQTRDLQPLEKACAALIDDLAEDCHDVEPLLHPLGFIYAPLARWGHATLRLHLWPPVARRRRLTADEVSPMHDHTWDLISYIAYGSLDNIEVGVVEVAEPSSADFRIFNICGEGPVDRVTRTDALARIAHERTTHHVAGSIYTQPAEVVHRTEAGAEPTVTLVLALRTGRQVERALGALDLPSYTSRRQAFPQTSFGEALRDVLADRRN